MTRDLSSQTTKATSEGLEAAPNTPLQTTLATHIARIKEDPKTAPNPSTHLQAPSALAPGHPTTNEEPTRPKRGLITVESTNLTTSVECKNR